MRLYLVRHGDSVTQGTEQVLSSKGIEETRAVAQLLKQSHLEIDEIVHSEKVRAQQTAHLIGQIAAPDLTLISRPGLKPNDPIESLIEEIKGLDRNLMIVGHLPFLEKLLTTLVLGSETLSPVDLCGSCVICLEGRGDNWHIAWVVTPELGIRSREAQQMG